MRRFRLFLLSVVYLVFQFALAAWGWGGFRAFFAQSQFIALLVLTAAMMGISLATEVSVSPGIKEDRSNRWVVGALTILGFLLAFFPAWTDRIGFMVFGGDALRWIGVMVFALGGALRIYPVFVLGRRFSGLVAIQEGHTLVTAGIYGRIRNPSYLGLLINMLGWALVFRSGVGIVICALTLLVVIERIRAEEGMLHEYFGVEFEKYCARTKRLIPWVY